MKNKNKIIAFIPLRGGSKSIPYKNVKILNGKPLAYWCIKAACSCRYIDKVIVSTDSPIIKETVKNFNFDKVEIINRSEIVSTDIASTESVMLEYATEDKQFSIITLIQATSPLLSGKDLDKAFEIYLDNVNMDSMISVVRQKRFLWERYGEYNKPINYDYLNRPRRQEFEGFLVENGAFYITTRDALLSSKCRVSGNIGTYEMNENSYYELDEPNDWLVVENLLKRVYFDTELSDACRQIKMLIMDCDGVLTDGGMYYSNDGEVLKKFNTRDGMGISLCHNSGIKTAIITGEKSEFIVKRAQKLKIDEVYLGVNEKEKILEKIVKKHNLSYEQIAYIGDDINDIQVLQKVGLPCSVEDAVPEVKSICSVISNKKGGEGAVREIIDTILAYKKI